MKKILLLTLCAALLTAFLVGCKPKVEPVLPDPSDPITDNPVQEPEIPDTSAEIERETILYLPNDNADGFDEKTATITDDPQSILDRLIENGALPEGMTVNTFQLQDDQAHIDMDVSSQFQTTMQSTGSAGESMYMGSLVNSILTAYQASTITITCDGSPLETGHSVYDSPLEFYDLGAAE